MIKDLSATEKKIYELALPFLSVRDNVPHTEDVVKFALKLLKTVPGNRQVVVPAVILHDVGWSKVEKDLVLKAYGPQKDPNLTGIHEEEGVKIATEILQEIGYDGKMTEEILQIIARHDTGKETSSINEQVAKDADKLSRFAVSFWLVIKNFGYDPREYYKYVESHLEQWLLLPVSKKLAMAELRNLRKKVGIPESAP